MLICINNKVKHLQRYNNINRPSLFQIKPYNMILKRSLLKIEVKIIIIYIQKWRFKNRNKCEIIIYHFNNYIAFKFYLKLYKFLKANYYRIYLNINILHIYPTMRSFLYYQYLLLHMITYFDYNNSASNNILLQFNYYMKKYQILYHKLTMQT